MARKSFLFIAVALLAAAGLAYTAAHKDHGSMIALDDVEWIQIEGTNEAIALAPTCKGLSSVVAQP